MKIPDRMAGAFNRAHPAAEADFFADDRAVVPDADSSGCAGLFADPAADTADRALFAGGRPRVMVGTFDNNIVGAVMNPNDLLRAGPRTGTAGNAGRLIHLRHTVWGQVDGTKLAGRNAGPASKAAEGASGFFPGGRAAAVAGYNSRFVGKLFSHGHVSPSFHKAYGPAAERASVPRRSGNRRPQWPGPWGWG